MKTNLKILFWDIESTPNLIRTFSTRNVWVKPIQIVTPQKVLCWSAKWHHASTTLFDSVQTGPKRYLQNLHKILSEADCLVGYNENRFDIPMVNAEFIKLGLTPPSPSISVDLYTTIRRRFAFPSYKLEYVVKALGIGEKAKNGGQELWDRCEAGDKKAWKEMQEYNEQDTKLLEPLYELLKPWIRNHPHFVLYNPESDKPVCDVCGSDKLRSDGQRPSALGLYRRYRCKDCGTWNRETLNKNKRAYLRAVH